MAPLMYSAERINQLDFWLNRQLAAPPGVTNVQIIEEFSQVPLLQSQNPDWN